MNIELDWQFLTQVGVFLAVLLLGWLLGSLVQKLLKQAEMPLSQSRVGQKLPFLVGLLGVLGSAAAPLLAYGLGCLVEHWLAVRPHPVDVLHWLLSFLPVLVVYRVLQAILQRRMPSEQASALNRNLLLPLLLVVLLVHGLGWTDELLAFSIQPGENPAITLRAVLISLLLLYLSVVLARLIRSYLRETFLPRTGINPAISQITSMLVFYGLLSVGLLISLNVLGIDLTALTVVAGGLSVGIGFGLQALFNNFVSGFILLMERSVIPGNFVRVADQVGTVKDIRLRSMLIRTVDDVDMVVPNGKVMEGVVINYSHGEARRRITVRASADLQSDPRLVEQLLLEALQHPLLLPEPAPEVFFSGLTQNALEFELYAYTGTPGQALRVASDIRYRIVELFRQHGVEMPKPPGEVRLDLHGAPVVPPKDLPAKDRANQG